MYIHIYMYVCMYVCMYVYKKYLMRALESPSETRPEMILTPEQKRAMGKIKI